MGAANGKSMPKRSKHQVNEQGIIERREELEEIDTSECDSNSVDQTQYDIIFHFDDFTKAASPHGCGISLGTRLQNLLWSDMQQNGWVPPVEGETSEIPEEHYSHFSLRGTTLHCTHTNTTCAHAHTEPLYYRTTTNILY